MANAILCGGAPHRLGGSFVLFQVDFYGALLHNVHIIIGARCKITGFHVSAFDWLDRKIYHTPKEYNFESPIVNLTESETQGSANVLCEK